MNEKKQFTPKEIAEALVREGTRRTITGEEINELIMTEDNIEISYHLEYCPACNQGGASGMGSVFSLLGCNIYDDHLHGEETDVPENSSEPDTTKEQTEDMTSDLVMR